MTEQRGPKMKIRIDYLYRDASNSKLHDSAVFRNPARWTVDQVKAVMIEAALPWQLFSDTIHFYPERVGLNPAFFTDLGYEENEDDTDIHEVFAIVECDDAPNDNRTIQQFLAELRETARAPTPPSSPSPTP